MSTPEHRQSVVPLTDKAVSEEAGGLGSAGDLVSSLRELAEKATPGPWFWPHNNVLASHPRMDGDGNWLMVLGTPMKDVLPTGEDAALIVAMRNNLDRLLDVVEAARALVAGAFLVPLAAEDDDDLAEFWTVDPKVLDAAQTALAALDAK